MRVTESAEVGNAGLDVSIVMPCLNEGESVAACVAQALEWIAKSRYSGEVVVVDNNSVDGSAELAAAAGARVVRETRPGYGAALAKGFSEARGRYLVMGDCDGTYDFKRLDSLIDPLDGDYDFVMGNRLTTMLEPGAMPWAHRRIGTPLISLILRTFTGARVTDSQCGIRAIRREALDQMNLTSSGMEFASEMILKAMRADLRMTEVDVPYYVRTGESKLSTFRDGWRHLKFLLVSSPGYVFIVPGLAALLLGLLSLGITVFTTSGVTVGSVEWEPVYAAAIFLVVGVNTVMLGVCSRLLGVREGLPEDGIVAFYRRYMGLGRMLACSALMALLAIGLHGWIFIRWLDDTTSDLLAAATVAASLLVIAANLAFASIAAAMIDPEA
jgi:glycosyltransferase involved in cell wall biosynthesis